MENYQNFLLLGATIAIAIGLIAGLLLALKIVGQVDDDLRKPKDRAYTILISRFPDPLILQFGYERGFLKMPSTMRLVFEPWGERLEDVLTENTRIAYANRRTASAAIALNGRITLREKWLCRYRGFAICLATTKEDDKQKALSERLRKGHILVRESTDQHDSLKQILSQFQLDAQQHILALPPEVDLLERALRDMGGNSGVIGFAGGITDRLVAQKLGYDVFGQPTILPEVEEANSFAYLHPDQIEDNEDLHYLLDQVEALWSEAVRQIQTDQSAREDFRRFLNNELGAQLGKLATRALKQSGQALVTHDEMSQLLGEWLRFGEKTN